MKANTILTWLAVSLAISIALSQSSAEETRPFSNNLKIDLVFERFDKWSHHQMQSQDTGLKIAPSMVIAGVLCFVAASISSAGGIGGGGLYIPILTIVASLDLKTASSFTAFMVTGGSVANVMCNMFTRSAKFGGQTVVDYDIAILSEPFMLLGVSVGVICNLVFPEWLVTILFAVFLACSTFKTCQKGIFHWNLESEEVNRNGYGNLENETSAVGSEEVRSVKEPLLGAELTSSVVRFPWMKLGILVIIWFSFSIISLLLGNQYGEVRLISASISPCDFLLLFKILHKIGTSLQDFSCIILVIEIVAVVLWSFF
ncbi:hypothetical protein OIU85_023165 [Salix viminalis]|uniref:Sulfite exporter TauE/SafE family protein n=1 Tax=Salix viminalis TaxID=40686 RepID=A0A9Q0U8C0_SALVM|nr:hypothetical protein OIU85_023165 [Salix viminalis]